MVSLVRRSGNSRSNRREIAHAYDNLINLILSCRLLDIDRHVDLILNLSNRSLHHMRGDERSRKHQQSNCHDGDRSNAQPSIAHETLCAVLKNAVRRAKVMAARLRNATEALFALFRDLLRGGFFAL